MTEIRERIVGSEMEEPIAILEHGGGNIPQPFVCTPEFISDYLPEGLTILTDMLSNGGKYYNDIKFAEYATPEETSFERMVTREFAGERIVIESIARYVVDHPEIKEATLRKRVIDDFGKTWGYHLNLSADRKAIPYLNDTYAHLLALHIATSQPLFGAGTTYYDRSARTSWYSYGQKVLDRELVDYATDTINCTSIINQREQPLGNGELYRRVHVTCVDPHISQWAAMMTPGAMSLVLRAIEQGKGDELQAGMYSNRSLVNIARTSATDHTYKRQVRMEEGPDMTPFQIQQEIVKIVSKTEHTDEEARVLAMWIKALEDFEQNPMLLRDRSDAIARLSLIRSFNIKRGNEPNDMSSVAARAASNYYDQLFEIGTSRAPIDAANPTDNYFTSHAHKIRTKQIADIELNEGAIQDAILNPPSTTRAAARAHLINDENISHVSWEYYKKLGSTIFLRDPYKPTL